MARKRSHRGGRRPGQGSQQRRRQGTLTGTLRVVRPGVATVETPEGTFAVAKTGIREGMNGDEVQVSLSPSHGSGEPQAFVQAVLQRATTTFLGTFGVADPLGVVVPLDARLRRDFFVLPEDRSAERLGVSEGDVVSARILTYPTRRSAGVATIDRRLGSAEELDMDMEAVVASYGLATEFPEPALAEARAVAVDAEGALARDRARADLRDLCCVTVDPADARDFDDAVSLVRTAEGLELGVHIADVTHYVAWGSSIDLEARLRTCSVYLADRVLPMLPEELCNDACSLRPNEDRLAMSVFVLLDERGRVVSSRATKSVIRSKARLDYDTVDDLLAKRIGPEGLPCDPALAGQIAETLRGLDEVARKRGRVRLERGALDFDTREAKVTLDSDGHPVGVHVREKTPATSLVEEAMLVANEEVARMLADAGLPCAFRVHERPAPEDLMDCLPALSELGLVRGMAEAEALGSGDPAFLQQVLERARGTGGEYLANALLLRAQKRAIYLPHNDGHYALGARAYCHFTSPIRRYPDVTVHRALKSLLGEDRVRETRQVEKAIDQLCRTCSDQERVADSAARASQRVKMAELYSRRVGQSFSGVVVGVERFGLFVMLDDTCAEGLLPRSALGDEWWYLDEARHQLVGESTGRIFGLGKRVAVTVSGAVPSRGQIDFVLAGTPEASRLADLGTL